MDPIETLMREHALILTGLDTLTGMADAIDKKTPLPVDAHREIVSFLRDYADSHHHAKEEDLLFPAMFEAGFPRDAGPVAVMLHEHTVGRGHVGAMLRAIEDGFGEAEQRSFADAAREFAGLLNPHIRKEDGILYPMALQRLSREALDQLEAEFAKHAEAHPDVDARAKQAIEALDAALASNAEAPPRSAHT